MPVEHGNYASLAARQVRLARDDGVFEPAGAQPAWIWVHTCPTPGCACRVAVVLAIQDGRDLLLARGKVVRDAWTSGAGYSKGVRKVR